MEVFYIQKTRLIAYKVILFAIRISFCFSRACIKNLGVTWSKFIHSKQAAMPFLFFCKVKVKNRPNGEVLKRK